MSNPNLSDAIAEVSRANPKEKLKRSFSFVMFSVENRRRLDHKSRSTSSNQRIRKRRSVCPRHSTSQTRKQTPTRRMVVENSTPTNQSDVAFRHASQTNSRIQATIAQCFTHHHALQSNQSQSVGKVCSSNCDDRRKSSFRLSNDENSIERKRFLF